MAESGLPLLARAATSRLIETQSGTRFCIIDSSNCDGYDHINTRASFFFFFFIPKTKIAHNEPNNGVIAVEDNIEGLETPSSEDEQVLAGPDPDVESDDTDSDPEEDAVVEEEGEPSTLKRETTKKREDEVIKKLQTLQSRKGNPGTIKKYDYFQKKWRVSIVSVFKVVTILK